MACTNTMNQIKNIYEIIREAARLPQPLATIGELLIGYCRLLDPNGQFEWLGNEGGVQYLNRPNNFFGVTILPAKELFQIYMKNPSDLSVTVRERLIPDGYVWNDSYPFFSNPTYEQLPDILTWMKRAVNMRYRRTAGLKIQS
jgi:hypothetical protein